MKIQYQSNGITVFESALYRTTSTIVELNDSVIIVDPNWLPIEVDFILDFVNVHYPKHNQYLLFTHSDYDHIIGYGAFPGAKVIASLYFENNVNKEDIIQQIIDFDHTYYITRAYPISYPTVDIKIITDGDVLIIDGTELVFYHAPGHVSDGLFVVIPDKKCWIAGDYLSNIEIPFIDHDYGEYLKTLHKAGQIFENNKDVNILIVGHGDVSTDRSDIKDRILLDTQYLDALGNIDGTDFTKLIHQYTDNPDMVKAHEKNLSMVDIISKNH